MEVAEEEEDDNLSIRSVTPPPSGHDSKEDEDDRESEAGSVRADEVESSQGLSQKARKIKKSYPVDRDKEEGLVEWVRENETLWHSKRQNFRDTAKKNGMWHDKGLEVGYTGEHLKGWWTHMRDTYTRLQKPKSGQNAHISCWYVLPFPKGPVR